MLDQALMSEGGRMLCNFNSILLSVAASKESARFTDQSVGIRHPQSATLAHRSKQDGTRNHSLILIFFNIM